MHLKVKNTNCRNLSAPLNRHFQGSIICCYPHALYEGWMDDANSEFVSSQASFSWKDVALQQEQGFLLWRGTNAMLSAVQNVVTPPCPLVAQPQSHEPFCAVGHRTRVWVVTGIHSLGENGVGVKRLKWKSPRERLCVCKGRGIWKWTGSELIAGLLRYRWEQD